MEACEYRPYVVCRPRGKHRCQPRFKKHFQKDLPVLNSTASPFPRVLTTLVDRTTQSLSIHPPSYSQSSPGSGVLGDYEAVGVVLLLLPGQRPGGCLDLHTEWHRLQYAILQSSDHDLSKTIFYDVIEAAATDYPSSAEVIAGNTDAVAVQAADGPDIAHAATARPDAM